MGRRKRTNPEEQEQNNEQTVQENEQLNTELNSNEQENVENDISNNESENVSEVNTETIKEQVEPLVEAYDKANEIKVGDKVKVDKLLSADIVGRRIHNGLKNYNYTVKVVRPDGIVHIVCMTYEFDVHKNNLTKI